MLALPIRMLFALFMLAGSFAAIAGKADDDLRTAAQLHMGGNTARAVAIWTDWAGQGNVDAAYNLAVIHQYGEGVPLDYAVAIR